MIETASRQLIEKEATPLVSVVLPVYNGQQYLAEAIDSILAQSFENFELIIADDGSTDGSRRIMNEYRERDARVRVLAHDNWGLATTLNHAIDIARGEWVARMDQDDIAMRHRFQRQLDWLETTGADISGSWVRRFGTSDKRIVKLRQTDEGVKMTMLLCSPFAHSTVMMRTALVGRLRYDRAFENGEDYDLWERAAEAGWKMTNVPEVLLRYRIHAAQMSAKTAQRQQHVAQAIRRRYWEFVCHAKQLNRHGIDEVLKIVDRSSCEVDMLALDALFRGLLPYSHGESREVVFGYATRACLRAAPSCPNVVSMWGKLHREFGEGWGVATKCQLWLFRLFRIRIEGDLFKQLKKFYVWRESL